MRRYSGPSIEDLFKQQLSIVDQARARGASLDDMISAIVGGGKQATVAAKVKAYQEQIGLTDYLNSLAKGGQEVKTASIPLKDHLENYIDNQIKVHHGHVTIPQLQSDLLALFGNKGLQPDDVYGEEFVRWVHGKLDKEKDKNQEDPVERQLGTLITIEDDEDDNYFTNKG